MHCNFADAKDLANLILTFILSGATIFLTIYTYGLLKEAKNARKSQIQPVISIHIEPAETDVTLYFIIIKNIGLGTAYNLQFEIIKDISDYGTEANQIGKGGLFLEGMKFCPPGFSKKYFLIETINDHDKKMDEELRIIARYNSALNESFDESFHLRLSEQRMTSLITPSDTHLGRIAESLKEIEKALKGKKN